MLIINHINIIVLFPLLAFGLLPRKRQHGLEQGHIIAARTAIDNPVMEANGSFVDSMTIESAGIDPSEPTAQPSYIQDSSALTSAQPSFIQDSSVMTPAPEPPPGTMQQGCKAEALSVSIIYWPQESTYTDCLATIRTEPPAPVPSGLEPVSPSVYAIIESFTITATNGKEFMWDVFTASFDPEEMSTQDGDGTTKSFNFADFPCPPPRVNLNGQPYKPFFAPPPSLLDQMGEGIPDFPKADCELGNWIDPATAIVSVATVNGPVLPVTKRNQPRPRTVAVPLETAHAPVKTPPP